MTARPITLVQFERKLGVPNASPFCVKLELWLKLAGIPFEIEEQMNPAKGPKHKIPYVIIDGEKMGDSTLIIEHLSKMYDIDIDAGLTDKERALSRSIDAMCDDRLYWGGVYDRWLGEGWPTISKAFFAGLPAFLHPVVLPLAQRSVRKQLWSQGTGRHRPEEIIAIAERDIKALSDILGDGPYVFGDTIRMVDCVVYSTAVNLTHVQLNTPVTRAARAYPNLVAYAERISAKYFPGLVAEL